MSAAKKVLPVMKAAGFNRSQFKAFVDGVFQQAEDQVAKLPFFGAFVSAQLKSLQNAVDLNIDGIYSTVIQAEVLSADTLVKAIEDFVPGTSLLLEGLRPLISALIQQQLEAKAGDK